MERTEYSTTDEDNDVQYNDTTDDEHSDMGMPAVPFFERERGPKHAGLSSIRPSNPLFDRLLSFRFYRLHRTDERRGSRETGMVRLLIKRLEIYLKEHAFSGKDPILVFDTLTRFVEEADTLGMTEAQAYLCLPYFLTDQASRQYRAARNATRSFTGGISCWPEAVQYVLRTYATPAAIREAVTALRGISQRADENELDFSARLNTAAYRCGNVHTDSDKMTLFVDDLLPETRTIVARFREQQPRYELTYEHLVQYARDEGDACRARNPTRKAERSHIGNVVTTARRSVHFLEPSIEGSVTNPDDRRVGEPLHLVDESVATSELPSTEASDEQLLYAGSFNRERRVMPPKINLADANTTRDRVGWVVKGPIICHSCYVESDHISPRCGITLRDLHRVVANYESLTYEKKGYVPDTSYKTAQEYIAIKAGITTSKKPEDKKETAQSKN